MRSAAAGMGRAAIVLWALAWSAGAGFAESLEDAAARDPLAGRPPSSFLIPGGGSGIVVPLPDAVEVILPGPGRKSAAALNVYFVSVGQGDAEYIELPNGKVALIDGGPAGARDAAGTFAEPPIAKFLAARGVSRIDYVVLTHPHSDHYAGLKHVLARYQVDHFYDTRIENSDAAGDNEVRGLAAAEPGCQVSYPRENEFLDWASGVQVKVLHSCPEAQQSSDFGKEASKALNNCSITLKMTYDSSSVLFVGDVQSDVETALAAKYGGELRSDVLKVGHHGSAQSSTSPFLARVQPKYAYIEVGRNSYGHPTQAALSRLSAVGAAVHRTDLEGTQQYAGVPALGGSVAAVALAR